MRATLFYPVLALLLIILVTGCNKDEEGTVRITFKGTFGNDPLVMFENHDYANGQRIQFTRSEFFVSELRLVESAGNQRTLSDIELVDLTFNSQSAAEAGVTFTFSGVPAGKYNDFRMGFGVSSDINATVPSDYPSSSPLSHADRYWTPWTSYIFSKTEGKLDTLMDGVDNPDLGFIYHTGLDDLYVNISLNPGTDISIVDGKATEITFYLDHSALMGLPDAPLDIVAKPQNHDPNDDTYLRDLLDNLISEALTYAIE